MAAKEGETMRLGLIGATGHWHTYATAASIHAATGYGAVVSFHAGNLGAVAVAIRQAHPGVRLIVCADDDRGTPGNDHIDWKSIAAALKAIDYRSDVVIESFTSDVTVIARAASIWRPMEPTRDEIAFKGVKFLKKVLHQ
jgi:sugar phosphate isomerase/epimerase